MFASEEGEDELQQYYKAMHEDDYRIQEKMENPLAYLSRSDPDTMYFDQAMNYPNRKAYLNADSKEVNCHCKRKH